MACKKNCPIELVRGTTYTRAIFLKNSDGTERQLAVGEILRFGVKASLEDKDYLVLKEIYAADYVAADGCYYLTLLPSDTEHMRLGNYYYDIGLQIGSDSYYNLLLPSPFTLANNVTGRAAVC